MQAPSTTTEEAASATTAPESPSADATFTALAWVCTAGRTRARAGGLGGAGVAGELAEPSGQNSRRLCNEPALLPALPPTVLFTDHRVILEQTVHRQPRWRLGCSGGGQPCKLVACGSGMVQTAVGQMRRCSLLPSRELTLLQQSDTRHAQHGRKIWTGFNPRAAISVHPSAVSLPRNTLPGSRCRIRNTDCAAQEPAADCTRCPSTGSPYAQQPVGRTLQRGAARPWPA